MVIDVAEIYSSLMLHAFSPLVMCILNQFYFFDLITFIGCSAWSCCSNTNHVNKGNVDLHMKLM